MLTSKKRPAEIIKMKCPAGHLIPRPPTTMVVPKWMRFYNWPKNKDGSPMEDYPGGPVPSEVPEVVVEVPNDHHHATLILKGSCSHVAAVAPKKKKDK